MKYTADDIQVITWPDPIRRRPGMYYKHLGTNGCLDLLGKLFTAIKEEKYQCRGKSIFVRLTRHNSITIEHDGRGMPITISNSEIPQPAIYTTLMQLAPNLTSPFINLNYAELGYLAEVGGLLNAACKYLHISTIWEGFAYSLSFREGCLCKVLERSVSDSRLNRLEFMFDSDVMGEFELNEDLLISFANDINTRLPGVFYGMPVSEQVARMEPPPTDTES